MVGIEPTTQKTHGLSTTPFVKVINGILVRLTTCNWLTHSLPKLSLITYHSTTQYSDLLENLKTCFLFKCSKAVLGSQVCSVQTLGGDMGLRYTFYRYVDRSSREDLYER